jgi:hypothetical protein
VITDSCIATISKRARAPITNPSYVIWVSTKIPRCDSTIKTQQTHQNKTKKNQINYNLNRFKFKTLLYAKKKLKMVLLGHKTAVIVPDNLPYDLIVLHFSFSS